MVVEVAERPPVADKETPSTVAQSFAHVRQREGNLAYPIEFMPFHAEEPKSFWCPEGRTDPNLEDLAESRPHHAPEVFQRDRHGAPLPPRPLVDP
jgi:hypothetical protein